MRPTLDQYLLSLAKVSASRSTCLRRQVGAVVADKRNVVCGTGYNGSPRGIRHCVDHGCADNGLSAPASHLACLSVHAEVNALLAAGKQADGGTLAVTTSPCLECTKVIINAGIRRLIFAEQNRLFEDYGTYKLPPAAMLAQAGVQFELIPWEHSI